MRNRLSLWLCILVTSILVDTSGAAQPGHADEAHVDEPRAVGAAKEGARESHDRHVEIAAEEANLWHIKTKSRLVKMQLIRR